MQMQRQTDTATTNMYAQLTAAYIAVQRQITRVSFFFFLFFFFFFFSQTLYSNPITRPAFVSINWIGLLRTHLTSLESGRLKLMLLVGFGP